MKINLLIVATNKYIIYLPKLIQSCQENFMVNSQVHFNIFTDKIEALPRLNNLSTYYIEHKPWPYPTLYRFHFFSAHTLPDADYYFYIDADAEIMAPVLEDILSDRTAVAHCMFENSRGTYETNPKSTSFVKQDEGFHYFTGSFFGFSRPEWFAFLNWATEAINQDLANGIVPVWHDESVLNRYLIDNPPTNILDPRYHYAEGITSPAYKCVIKALEKDHNAMRY